MGGSQVGRGWVADPTGAQARRRNKKNKLTGTTPEALTRLGNFITPFGDMIW